MNKFLQVFITIVTILSTIQLYAFADTSVLNHDSSVNVSSFEEMYAALPSEVGEQICVATLTQDLVLTEGQDIRTLGKLIIPSGVTLTICGYFEAETEIQPGGTLIVESGGYFSTTMGGDINNFGRMTVFSGGTIESKMGGKIRNHSVFQLNGMCYVGGTYDKENNCCEEWFVNDTSAQIAGSGHIVVNPVFVIDSNEDDDASVRIEATKALKLNINGINEVPIYTTATNFSDMQTFVMSADVEGIYLIYPDGTDIYIADNLDLGIKKLCLTQDANLIINNECTLTLGSLDDLSFCGRFAGIKVKAGNGTLTVGNTPIMSGSDYANAVFTVTRDYMALSTAQWSMFDCPTTAKCGGWYYVHNTDGAVNANGVVSEEMTLPLLVDGTLNITDNFTYPNTIEIRNELNVSDGANAIVKEVVYCVQSKESSNVLKGTEATLYDLELDLNCGNGFADKYSHRNNDNGRIYLDEEESIIFSHPTRSGYTFMGWKATSNWTCIATSEKLSLFANLLWDEKNLYVPAPFEFPVIMVAQWSENMQNKYKATISVNQTENIFEFPEVGACRVYAAIYDENQRLLQTSFADRNENEGVTLNLSVTSLPQNYTIKLFFWNPDNLEPLCPVIKK